MMLRSEKKTAKDVYLYDSIGSDKEGNEINLIDVIEYTDEDVVERVTLEDNTVRLEGFIEKSLSPREKDIIRMRYGLGEGRKKHSGKLRRFMEFLVPMCRELRKRHLRSCESVMIHDCQVRSER